MAMPNQGDLFDIVIDKIPDIKKIVVARFRVLRRDEERDTFIIQCIDVRQEAMKNETRKES